MKKIVKIIFSVAFIFSVLSLGAVAYCEQQIGDNYCVSIGKNLVLNDGNTFVCKNKESSVTVGKSGNTAVGGYRVQVSLFGVLPIKNVNVTEADDSDVVVLGTPFGIKMYTEGVLVVGYSDVETIDGTKNPAKDVGILIGDTILSINGQAVSVNADVQNILKINQDKQCDFVIKRNDKQITIRVAAVLSKGDGIYKIGLWIRDSSAGIGTLTFYDPNSGVVAGLGHGICDTDTGELLPCESGQLVEAEIVGIKKSTKDVTGELQGIFSGSDFAKITANDITGVYGCDCGVVEGGYVFPVALKQEIKVGKAQILTTTDSDQPKLYDCVLKKVYHNDSSKIKNIVIEVTDPELLEKTGGIVQGMSGSPILQNGKLIGAVTHVLVDDPTKGYGIFAENMLETAQSVAEEKLKEAS